MLLTPASSPRRSGALPEAAAGNSGGSATDIDPTRGRGQMPREYQFQQRQRNFQRTRPTYNNMPPPLEYSSYYPRPTFTGVGPRYGGGVPLRRGPGPTDRNGYPVAFNNKLHHKQFIEDMSTESKISEEKYRAQFETFPELPQLAHDRIREFGNEILACYSVQLCKFFNDSLIESSPNSFAVFTKKTRTGQRWLMVFKCERGRVNICFNKLLTNQLVVRCLNPVSVEVEPSLGGGLNLNSTTPQETCAFTFVGHSEATKFVQDIHESQTIVWNHREMSREQTLSGLGPISNDYYGHPPPPNLGYYPLPPPSPRHPVRSHSARVSSNPYFIPTNFPHPLTPRMKPLPPVMARSQRSPFTMTCRNTTQNVGLDENWRMDYGLPVAHHATTMTNFNAPPLQTSLTPVPHSPIRKRSRGSSTDKYANAPVTGGGCKSDGDGDGGDFVYNSLTHSMALQNSSESKAASTEEDSPLKEASTARKFQISDVLVSNKRDVGAGAVEDEFFSIGAGELHIIDNGNEQLDEIKCVNSGGHLLFSQTLFGWNKVKCPEENQQTNSTSTSKDRCWWIGAATLGADGMKLNTLDGGGGGDAPKIREFKATFSNEETAKKFAELFQKGAVKGNNPDVRKRYLAQSLRI